MSISSATSRSLQLIKSLWIVLIIATAVSGQDVTNEVANSSQRPASQLKFRKWSGDINVPDPVSISFDDHGRAYVTQTTRRKIQDLDIREHRDWIPNDVSFHSVQDKIDFYRARLATPAEEEPADKHRSLVQDVNGDGIHDFRDLQVLSEKIHWLEDSNRDGTADQSGLFAEQFQTEVTGIAAGVLAHNGDVYATIAPDVWKLTDTNGDGVADEREIFATGFGMHIAYAGHDMHGLTVGPDGRIYWSVGDKGVNIRSKEGKHFVFPNQGAVLRCEPDGSGLEVFAHGLRNVQELAFDHHGNLFGFDNDSDQPDERERFVWIVKGLDAGWRCNYQYRGKDYNPWMAERMWEPYNASQPAHIVPPIVNSINGPCGFAFNPGTALSPDYKDYFFLTGTIKGEQIAFQIQPNGDSFKMTNEHTIGAGTPLIGINFSPSGGLYGVDWGGGYPLNQKGAVWEIDVAEYRSSELRNQTAQLISLDYNKASTNKLVELLGHPDQRVRLKAQFELVRRNDSATLVETATEDNSSDESHPARSNKLARIHAIWGIGQLLRRSNTQIDQSLPPSSESRIALTLAQLLKDTDSDIRTQAVKVLAESPNVKADELVLCLEDDNLHVRIQAALALGHRGDPSALLNLVDLATKLKPSQSYLRHAVSSGLAGIESKRISGALRNAGDNGRAQADNLQRLANHDNQQVRLAAVIALRKLSVEFGNHDKVRLGAHQFLNDIDKHVATEAALAIYDDFSIGSELRFLAETLESRTANQLNEPFVRRAIGANFRIGGADELSRVANFATTENVTLELRLEAIDALADWASPHPLDRVTGRYRGRAPMTGPADPSFERQVDLKGCQNQLLSLVESDSSSIQSGTIKAIRSLNIPLSADRLVKILESDLAIELRVEALSSLAFLPSASDNKIVITQLAQAYQTNEIPLRQRALQWMAKLRPDMATENIAELLESRTKRNKGATQLLQTALTLLGEIGTSQSDELLGLALDSLLEQNNKFPARVTLEILEAAEARAEQSSSIAKQLATYNNDREPSDIGGYTECLTGGSAEIGKQIFNTNVTAQCVRCHRIGNKGSTAGPNLKGVASRQPAAKDPEHLLRSIVAPSAHIDPKYQTMMFLLFSGDTIQGVVVREDKDTIVVADATGKEIIIPIDDIDAEKKQKLSTMPEPKGLSKREIRDLVAFLSTLKKK